MATGARQGWDWQLPLSWHCAERRLRAVEGWTGQGVGSAQPLAEQGFAHWTPPGAGDLQPGLVLAQWQTHRMRG